MQKTFLSLHLDIALVDPFTKNKERLKKTKKTRRFK